MMLKVGIAGYGIVGKRRRLFVDAHEALKTVAVCDQSFTEDGRMDDGVAYFTSYEKLLDIDLDILFVCLTNDVNPKATIAGLENGFHVFCEKPPGRCVDDVRRVVECAQIHQNLKLKYGFNHRYHESVVDALAIVATGELGNVINLRGIYGKSKLITFGQTSWRTERAKAGGGVLLDQGIHMVDLLRLFAGEEFTQVHSIIQNSYWQHDVEDNAYALMKTNNDTVAILHSSATQWRHRFSLEIALERGSISLSGILSGS
ncbi:MAG: Gfo/Idh/MocA family oxidoreductase, partial [Rhodospirillales bacterium]|nr:Gfo/Idh/MocA family oxidoreductase [Rhodospirillales bacterium]